MAVRQPHYSKEEFARRGDEIYEIQVRSQVETGIMAKLWLDLKQIILKSLKTF